MTNKCSTCGSTATIDDGTACAQCGCDREDNDGLAPTAGSETPPPMPTPEEIAVAGYLQNRQTLCEHLATISSTYDREKDRRKSIVDEIEKIDRCVARILDTQNVHVEQPGTTNSPNY